MKPISKSKSAKNAPFPNNLRKTRLSKIDPKTGEPFMAKVLAEAIQKSQTTISLYEKGLRKIVSLDLGRICQTLNCTAEEIMGVEVKDKTTDHEAYELAVGAIHDACNQKKSHLDGKHVSKLSTLLYKNIVELHLNTRQIHTMALSLVDAAEKPRK